MAQSADQSGWRVVHAASFAVLSSHSPSSQRYHLRSLRACTHVVLATSRPRVALAHVFAQVVSLQYFARTAARLLRGCP